jgi:hypothetical protein
MQPPPPGLNKQYQCIAKVPLDKRVKSSTIFLQRWIARVRHQREMTRHLEKKHHEWSENYFTMFQ